MSYFLFLNHNGHDYTNLPYEAWGGIALNEREINHFISSIKHLETATFGVRLSDYGSFPKGHRLLSSDRIKWANQDEQLNDMARRKHAKAFLDKGHLGHAPTRQEFSAYGQACLQFARSIFGLLKNYDAPFFATAIPKESRRPKKYRNPEFIRKDVILLFERYFHLLESKKTPGFLMMDFDSLEQDANFIKRLNSYFTETRGGRFRAHRIISAPIYAEGDMQYPMAVSDILLYCLNVGFRLPRLGMNAPTRPNLASEFGPWISNLQYLGELHRSGEVYKTKGIVYVSNPYGRSQSENRN